MKRNRKCRGLNTINSVSGIEFPLAGTGKIIDSGKKVDLQVSVGRRGEEVNQAGEVRPKSAGAVPENGDWNDFDTLKAVLENLTEGVVVVDRDGEFLFFNRVAEKILGMGSIDSSPSEWTRRFGCFLPDGSRLIAPGELPLVRSLQGEEVYDFEMLIKNPHIPDGVLIRVNSIPLYDEQGALRGGVVWFRDITAFKKAEEHLERLSNAVEQTADSVFITNKNFVIEYVNPAFIQTTGYEQEEALGSTPGLLRSGQHPRGFYENLRETISRGDVFRGTIINRKKNGQIYWTEQTITPMKSGAGEITHYVSVLKDVTEQRRQLEQEFQIRLAREVQQRYYRETSPSIRGFDIAGAAFPAAETGGDYFDFLLMPDGCLGIAIGDVSGHGFGSSLIMAETRAYIRAFSKTDSDVGRILTRLNRVLDCDLEDGRHVTLLLGRLDPKKRTIVYASAGHIPCYLIKASGQVGRVLESTGMPLGLFPDAEFESSECINLDTGDLLAFLTDGVTETTSPEEAEFGPDRVLDILKRNQSAPAREIVGKMHDAACRFSGDQPPHDDITTLVCKVIS